MIIHTGYWKDEQTGIDVGLQARFHGEGRVDLHDWYTTVTEEADHINALAGIFHPKATKAIIETTGDVSFIEATFTKKPFRRPISDPLIRRKDAE